MPSQNSAAWLNARRQALVIDAAPYPTPSQGEIVVRNRAVAVNPADWIIQSTPRVVFPWVKGPAVLGTDVAGDIVQIGDDVSQFVIGDRVLGHALGVERGHDHGAEGAFQFYTVLKQHMACAIPDTMAFTDAAVLPLGVSTAATGLFQKDQLSLRHPGLDPAVSGECIVICGGATSLGHNATQLAHAAGYDVIVTCSPSNAASLQKLGAGEAVDYHSPSVIDDLVDAISGRPVAGAMALSPGTSEDCIRVMARSSGRRFVAQAGGMASVERLGDGLKHLPQVMLQTAAAQTRAQVAARRAGVATKFIWGSSLASNEVSRIIYQDYLPAALANGSYQAAPEPLIVGDGLAHLQAAFDRQRAGVSARKVVVTLDEESC